MKKEMEERINTIRPEITSRIKEAKELGDLSENSEFDAAKEAQSFNEGRIEELKRLIDSAVIFSDRNNGGQVDLGSTVKVESKSGEVRTFVIVGAAESDPGKGLISNESPLGQAFIGHKKKDTLEIKTPKGTVEYKILDVH
ncbi:MAG: Transcription elongation factor GreA [Candidatus Yanofskybacteria bacterium GW2011_GWA1_44_21]|uniref:Transcription elongation factor GreA n=1 Tax=Candidatus Wolfebacteria bacterium GW2011_GWB1_41_12 TaxID=1619006 RepID=A0A0G0UIM2_9BACT|nr:MAG: Transcription elongation factor GreA [Candidatus Wolfebacteria bacterium GW2011_GWB1_41_12]KKT28891.1 MAG: Transcription elongation factor GreA [Candidatus Yanofskybacteria bacterium GW2011_GWA2_44_10]KKT50805.1 MAG: Transcription elongation factor GreA [Candidatus Yanofskybacteria bacterium GW2011_GWA1_44_21]